MNTTGGECCMRWRGWLPLRNGLVVLGRSHVEREFKFKAGSTCRRRNVKLGCNTDKQKAAIYINCYRLWTNICLNTPPLEFSSNVRVTQALQPFSNMSSYFIFGFRHNPVPFVLYSNILQPSDKLRGLSDQCGCSSTVFSAPQKQYRQICTQIGGKAVS